MQTPSPPSIGYDGRPMSPRTLRSPRTHAPAGTCKLTRVADGKRPQLLLKLKVDDAPSHDVPPPCHVSADLFVTSRGCVRVLLFLMRTRATGGMLTQIDDLKQLVNRQAETIAGLASRVEGLEAEAVSVHQFKVLKAQTELATKNLQRSIREKQTGDKQHAAWFTQKLAMHTREIKMLLAADGSKQERLQVVEEQMAGMDFDIYATKGGEDSGAVGDRFEAEGRG